eukprot:CAMPEP_0197436382 /NCGR_PEP_ID=MMETSP1175-20131217/3838_1 /TAXON_ID=1003142 /ORGANISM="Triceratium dubium, Strain CCMP147" /LENGTH=208 /DNA_ID=CAMNT_0042965653 /DNA_START=82 /DNA_END=708 /DNA_ORIENTATION=-
MINLQADTLICRPISSRDNETIFHNPSVNYVGGMSGFNTTFGRDEKTGEDKKIVLSFDLKKMASDLPSHERRTTSHMHGGFSLHDIPWMIECIKQYGDIRNWTEDDLWTYCLNYMEYNRSGLPSSEVTEFQAWWRASDGGLTKCLQDSEGNRLCPFGVHKPWRNMDKYGNYTELVDNCPGLDRLEQIHSKYNSEEDQRLQVVELSITL